MPNVTPELELGFNCITHALILFSALTVLFAIIITKVSTNAMSAQVKNAIGKNLAATLKEQNTKTHGLLRLRIKQMDPILANYEASVQRPDEATRLFNEGLFMNAYLLIALLTTALVVMLCVVRWGAKMENTGRVFLTVLLGNAVTFGIIGGVEYLFFDKIARKYCPTRPSLITESIVKTLKDAL